LSNVGEKSIYDGAIALSCDCPIDIEKHDADLVLDRADTYSASFRLSCPMHPGDRERKISWNVIGQPFPDIVGVEKTRIKFESGNRDAASIGKMGRHKLAASPFRLPRTARARCHCWLVQQCWLA